MNCNCIFLKNISCSDQPIFHKFRSGKAFETLYNPIYEIWLMRREITISLQTLSVRILRPLPCNDLLHYNIVILNFWLTYPPENPDSLSFERVSIESESVAPHTRDANSISALSPWLQWICNRTHLFSFGAISPSLNFPPVYKKREEETKNKRRWRSRVILAEESLVHPHPPVMNLGFKYIKVGTSASSTSSTPPPRTN
jgi:hypothetical protein